MRIVYGKRIAVILSTIFVLVLAAQGCGKSSSSDTASTTTTTTTTTTSAAVQQEVECNTVTIDKTVAITGSSFVPGSVTINVNNVVMWTNNDSITHTVTSGAPGAPTGKFNTTLTASKSKCMRFLSAGSFPYYCEIHPSMTGTVTVQ